MDTELPATAQALPLSERIELAEALWDSITRDGYEPPLSPAQGIEMDRRVEEHRRDPHAAISWERVRAGLEEKYGKPR